MGDPNPQVEKTMSGADSPRLGTVANFPLDRAAQPTNGRGAPIKIIAAVAGVLICVWVLQSVLASMNYETTDDAFVGAPILMISADPSTFKGLSSLHGRLFLMKPFDKLELTQAINEVLHA